MRDLRIGGRPSRVRIRKRIWRCPEPACPTMTWSEPTGQLVRPRATLTVRAELAICRRVGEDGHAVAQVARDFRIHGTLRWTASTATAARG